MSIEDYRRFMAKIETMRYNSEFCQAIDTRKDFQPLLKKYLTNMKNIMNDEWLKKEYDFGGWKEKDMLF